MTRASSSGGESEGTYRTRSWDQCTTDPASHKHHQQVQCSHTTGNRAPQHKICSPEVRNNSGSSQPHNSKKTRPSKNQRWDQLPHPACKSGWPHTNHRQGSENRWRSSGSCKLQPERKKERKRKKEARLDKQFSNKKKKNPGVCFQEMERSRTAMKKMKMKKKMKRKKKKERKKISFLDSIDQ